MSAEWKGPWKCEKCGYRYVAGVPGGRCRCGEDEETRCTGTLVPYDRRAPEPSADGLRELIAQAAPLSWVMRNDADSARAWEIEAKSALPAPQEAKGESEYREGCSCWTDSDGDHHQYQCAIHGLHPAPVLRSDGLRGAAKKVADRMHQMLEGGCECDSGECVCGYDSAMREWAELDALLSTSPASDEAVVENYRIRRGLINLLEAPLHGDP